MSRHIRPGRYPGTIALILTVLLTLQFTPAGALAESTPGFMAADEEMVQKLLHVRTRDELVTELDSAKRRLSAAQADLAEFERIGSVVSARVGVKRQEMDLIKQRVRLAKNEADETKVAALEEQWKDEGSQLKVFEAMREAAAAQIDRARAARDFAQARIDLQELEMKLVDRREARVTRAAGAAGVNRHEELAAMDKEIRVASRKMLSSIRDYARRSERLAKTTESLARSNLHLLDIWEEHNAR